MKILFNILANILQVKIEDMRMGGGNPAYEKQYAFYLMKDEAVKEKIWYSEAKECKFELKEYGQYYVTIFERNGGDTSIQKTPAIYYYGRSQYCNFFKIEEMEMTNNCNLNCHNCGTPTTGYKKGFIDDSTVMATLSWTRKGQTLNYHRVGEPLLHPKLCTYIQWGVDAGVKPVISTNGVLLTEEMLIRLYNAGLRHLVITLHTKKSLDSFLMCCKWFVNNNIEVVNFSKRHLKEYDENGNMMFFQGKVLAFSQEEEQGKYVRNNLDSIPSEFRELLQMTPVHTWAGNVEGTKRNLSIDDVINHQKNCYFIKQHVINVRWDGTIVGCCFDFENENELGNIREYASLNNSLDKYRLCKQCDANWAIKE